MEEGIRKVGVCIIFQSDNICFLSEIVLCDKKVHF